MATDLVPDSERTGLIGALPHMLRPYASLMRLDRPIGTWLLYWPCAWSVALAGVKGEWLLFAWLLLGAFAMRSAGCAYNDIVDRELDKRVERTRLRPLASGRVSAQSRLGSDHLPMPRWPDRARSSSNRRRKSRLCSVSVPLPPIPS